MCFRTRSATASRPRPQHRQAPTLPPLAMLDLSKPGERQAHDFLLHATNPKDRMWTVIDVRRHGDVLLCVVRWAHPERKTKPFALAEVSLAAAAVRWRDYESAEPARAEMMQRCAACWSKGGSVSS